MGALTFKPGEFYGRSDVRREGRDFLFASLTAVGHEDDVETHVHATAHFVLVHAGAYVTAARGAPEAACAPVLVFNPAGMEHRDRFAGGRGRFLALTLKDDTRGERSRLLDGPAVLMNDPFALRTARLVERELRAPDSRTLVLEGAAWQLVGDGEDEQAKAPPPWLKTALEMIRESDPADLTVAAVAAYAGVHPVHLARVFRDWLGCTPGEYLRGKRLERAASLLGRTALALAEVAAVSGYTDQAHLNRACRHGLGATPGAFRRSRQVARVQYCEAASP